MSLLPIAAGIAAVVVGWNVYWWHVENRVKDYMGPDATAWDVGITNHLDYDKSTTFWTMRMWHKGQILVCENKLKGKCVAIGPWGKPGPDPYEHYYTR